MIMQQLTGYWHTESCNHFMKVRENINPKGDEGHNRLIIVQKRFPFTKGLNTTTYGVKKDL
jgi:hypothetical protein